MTLLGVDYIETYIESGQTKRVTISQLIPLYITGLQDIVAIINLTSQTNPNHERNLTDNVALVQLNIGSIDVAIESVFISQNVISYNSTFDISLNESETRNIIVTLSNLGINNTIANFSLNIYYSNMKILSNSTLSIDSGDIINVTFNWAPSESISKLNISIDRIQKDVNFTSHQFIFSTNVTFFDYIAPNVTGFITSQEEGSGTFIINLTDKNNIKNVLLHVILDGKEFIHSMKEIENGTYVLKLTGFEKDTTIYYYITAEDESGNILNYTNNGSLFIMEIEGKPIPYDYFSTNNIALYIIFISIITFCATSLYVDIRDPRLGYKVDISQTEIDIYKKTIKDAQKYAKKGMYDEGAIILFRTFTHYIKARLGIAWNEKQTLGEFMDKLSGSDVLLGTNEVFGLGAAFERTKYGKEVTKEAYELALESFKALFKQMFIGDYASIFKILEEKYVEGSISESVFNDLSRKYQMQIEQISELLGEN